MSHIPEVWGGMHTILTSQLTFDTVSLLYLNLTPQIFNQRQQTIYMYVHVLPPKKEFEMHIYAFKESFPNYHDFCYY